MISRLRMSVFEHRTIEPKWQARWEQAHAHETDLKHSQNKCYCLVMFSYPSAKKLHIGHWYNYGPTDTWARWKRLQGLNVFEPMGFDAFGLPAENQAIKEQRHPRTITYESIDQIRGQLKQIGAMYDWSKEAITSEPEYYKWTQWIFLQLFKHALAYKKKAPVNWCPTDRTVLANEQVIDGCCERCGTPVEQKELEQWFFRITEYVEDLLKFDHLDWPERTKLVQKNWIGKSEGANIVFQTEDKKHQLRVFTTRPDTLFGASFLVLAPEHELVEALTPPDRREAVAAYREQAGKRTTAERELADREKTGVPLGSYVINPATKTKIPIWIADYVLLTYGSGIVMAVPGHDTRDYAFAKKYKLPIVKVINPPGVMPKRPLEAGLSAGGLGYLASDLEAECWTGEGTMINSGHYNGLSTEQVRKRIVTDLERSGQASFGTSHRLRDWLVSRQRYWGAPIPVIYCDEHGAVPVPEKDLPVLLPDDVDFQPTGESPLTRSASFVTTTCPLCKKPARREVDTLDTFVDSSWYFFRYLSPHDPSQPFDKKLVRKWMPVDLYVGGAEHATLHLLYARFIAKVLMRDRAYEPFHRLRHQGTITKNGAKMSKSKGNVVNPDAFVEQFGSDTFRMFLMFMGPYEDGGDWSDRGILGIRRFLDRVYTVYTSAPLVEASAPILARQLLHRTIHKVSADLDKMHFHTAIASLMECLTGLTKLGGLTKDQGQTFLTLLAPFAPHLAEELWERIGHANSIFTEHWPSFDPSAIEETTVPLILQVNGKLRDTLTVEKGLNDQELVRLAQGSQKVQKYISGKTIRRTIVVKDKLVNFVL